MNNFDVVNIEIVNDQIWALISCNIVTNYNGGIIRYDSNGNMNLLKLYTSTTQSNRKFLFFQPVHLILIDDGGLIMNGRVLYSDSLIGFSNSSSTDQFVFKLNQNGDIQWTTTLDFRLGYDAASEMTSYSNIVYSGMYTDLNYPCFFSINGTNGKYLISNCFTFFYNSTTDNIESFQDITLFIGKELYLFLVQNKLDLLLVYNIPYTSRMYPIYKMIDSKSLSFISPVCNGAYMIKINETQSDIESGIFSLYDPIKFNVTLISYTQNGTNPNEIHWIGNDMNIRYFDNITMLQDSNGFVNYQEIDATSCLWPNYISELQNCPPILPTFVLDSEYNIRKSIVIEVKEDNPTNYTFTAYIHCRDSKFLFRVCIDVPSENIACVAPIWISYEMTSGHFTIDTSKILSVGTYNLTFQSQLIGYSLNSTYLNTTVSTYESIIILSNENCYSEKDEYNWYIISQQIKNFLILFNDLENDSIIVKLVESNDLNVYIQKQNKSSYELIIMGDANSISTAKVLLNYTDRYHQDSQFWKQISINVNLFKSEPPVFVGSLEPIIVDFCSQNQSIYKLPGISDIDSTIFNVYFADTSIQWMNIKNVTNTQLSLQEYYILINNSFISKDVSNTTLTLILSDDSGAFTSYELNVVFQSNQAFTFGKIDNIKVNALTPYQIEVDKENLQIHAYSCDTHQNIDWICYFVDKKVAYVYNQAQCRFDLEGCDNSKMFGTYCVQLSAIDSCSNYVESNKFNVTIKPSTPFAQTNTIQSIYVYANHYTEVQLPDFLFYNKEVVASNLRSSNCINSNSKLATRITEDSMSKSLKLFVKVFGTTGCNISILSNNSFCQSSEFIVDIVVLKCASKECFECAGPYDSDCIACESGFALNSDGSCIRDMKYIPTTSSKFYWILGLFAMIVTLIHILL